MLNEAGADFKLATVDYTGHEDDDVLSPYAYYCGTVDGGETKSSQMKPKDGSDAEEGTYYSVLPYGMVSIDSVMEQRKNSSKRLYDKYDRLFSKVLTTNTGDTVMVQYYSPSGEEIITDDRITGTVTVKRDGDNMVFGSRIEFMIEFIKKAGLAEDTMLYNSTDMPLEISQELARKQRRRKDLLVWQEKSGTDVPMKIRSILEGRTAGTAKIFVEDESAYEAIKAKDFTKRKVSKLSELAEIL